VVLALTLKLVPVGTFPKEVPPVATVYHAIEVPTFDVAIKLVVPPGAHNCAGVADTNEGTLHCDIKLPFINAKMVINVNVIFCNLSFILLFFCSLYFRKINYNTNMEFLFSANRRNE
jgi:hypothetical protein